MRTPFLVAALVALVLLAAALARTPAASAQTDGEVAPGLVFAVEIDGLEGCDTLAGDVTCTVASGSTFVVNVLLDAVPPSIGEYQGFDLVLRHQGVTPQQDASTDAWPDCGFPAQFYGADFIGFGCAVGVPPAGPSTHTGVIGTVSFTCGQSGFVALIHGRGNTDLVRDVGQIFIEAEEGYEAINVVCGQVPSGSQGTVATATPGPQQPLPGTTPSGAQGTPPDGSAATEPPGTGQPTAPSTPGPTPTEGPDDGTAGDDADDDGGFPGWAIAVIIVVAVGVAGIGGVAGWRYLQGRRPPPAASA